MVSASFLFQLMHPCHWLGWCIGDGMPACRFVHRLACLWWVIPTGRCASTSSAAHPMRLSHMKQVDEVLKSSRWNKILGGMPWSEDHNMQNATVD